MNNGNNPLKLSWREVIDATNISAEYNGILSIEDRNEVVSLVKQVGYRYLAYRGIVYNVDWTEICTVYDLVPR